MTPQETICGFEGADLRHSPEYLSGIEVGSRVINQETTEEPYYCRCKVCDKHFVVTAHHGYHFPQYTYPVPPCKTEQQP